jgi:hypothetical protein
MLKLESRQTPIARSPATPSVQVARDLPGSAPQTGGANVRSVSGPLIQFRTWTGLVMADATVGNQDGKAVEGLGAGDSVVTKDGKQLSAFSNFKTGIIREFRGITSLAITPGMAGWTARTGKSGAQ